MRAVCATEASNCSRGRGSEGEPYRTVRHASEGEARDVLGAVAFQVAQREHQLARERERQAAGRVKAAHAGDAAARQQADQLRRDARALGDGPIRELERWLALPRVCSPRSDFLADHS